MFILVLSLLITNISAGVYFSQLGEVYNLGDMIEVEMSVDPVLEGYLIKTSLICDGNNVIEFNNFPENGMVNIKLPLNFNTIKEFTGDCYFRAEYAGDNKNSRSFKISKILNVRLDGDSFFVNPGEEVIISGGANRLTGTPVNGDVEITIPLLSLASQAQSESVSETSTDAEQSINKTLNESGGETSEQTIEEAVEQYKAKMESVDNGAFNGKVVDGLFSISVNLPKNTPAGDYRIDVLVYEESSGKRSSEGVAMANLKVFQVLTGIDIALSNQNFNPGDKFSFKPLLTDQSGVSISDEVSVIIRDEKLERIFEKIVKSDESVEYDIPTNLTAGYYEVEASISELKSIKKFYVNEKARVSFELLNDTLIVTNIGNIPYMKDIQVELNGKPFVKKVNLDLGENQEFELTGNGAYDIRVSDGETEISRGGVALTGYAVGVKEVKEGMSSLKTPIIWIFFIVILGIGILFLFRNVFKKKSYAFPFSGKNNKVVELKPGEKKQEVKKFVKQEIKTDKTIASQSQAEQVLVLKGHKNSVAVIALKIKNKIGKIEKQSLEKAIEQVYKRKGAVYEQGDYIFAVFSPLITKTFNNEVEAAKAAENIALVLNEHNKKFKDKIEFGIGINTGDVINKIENKKLKFTALGNVVLVAKRLADSSDGQILVTKQAYEKGIVSIKAEKRKISSGEVYELRAVVDQEKNKKFLDGFLERMKKEDKK